MAQYSNVIKELFRVPLDKLFLILGVVCVLVAFVHISYVDSLNFKLTRSPNYWLLSIGIVLIIICIYRSLKPGIPRSAKVMKIENGFTIKIDDNHLVDIVNGKIEDMEVDESHGVVVLPANTSFDDECIRDSSSSLGAFFQKHFPNGIEQIQEQIEQEKKRLTKSDDLGATEYPLGTTIFLDRPLGSSHRVLIVAVTRFFPEDGIKADSESLAICIKSILKKCSSLRISEVVMPVIGTGHGGLDFKAALIQLLIAVSQCIKHEGTHHVKHLVIVAFDPGGKKRTEIENIVQLAGTIV